MKKLALIVPVFNQFELFTGFVSTINYPVHPYIIPNWKNNIGVAAAWNSGMRNAIKDGYRYALISNDDVLLEKKSVESCLNIINDTGVAIVSPNFCVPSRDGQDMYFERDLGLIESIHWSCFIVDMYQLIENCGWFDENFYPAYFEDNDMFYRMHLSGLRHLLDTENGFYHKQSATCIDVVTQGDWEKCQQYYIEKWGGPPGEETFIRPFNDTENGIDFWKKR